MPPTADRAQGRAKPDRSARGSPAHTAERRDGPSTEAPANRLQRQAGNHAVSALLGAAPDAPTPHSGVPIPESLRTDMERRFDADFRSVRLHVNDVATSSAAALGAKAYTIGHDIVFGDGRYAPESFEGRRLLAHELAHVVQQRRGGAPPAAHGDGPLEIAADSSAHAVATGAPSVAVAGASGVGVARAVDDDERKRSRLLLQSGAVPPSHQLPPGPATVSQIMADQQAVAALQKIGAKKGQKIAAQEKEKGRKPVKDASNVKGEIFEMLLDREIRRRIELGSDLDELLPEGTDRKNIRFVSEPNDIGKLKPGEAAFFKGRRISKRELAEGKSRASRHKLSDGMIIMRDNSGELRVLTVLESKSGARRASDLHRADAGRETPTSRQNEELRKYERDMTRKGDKSQIIASEWGGQVGQDVERLDPGEQTEILIDRVPVQVRSSRTKTRYVGVVPRDVDINASVEALNAQGINMRALHLASSEAEILVAANDIIRVAQADRPWPLPPGSLVKGKSGPASPPGSSGAPPPGSPESVPSGEPDATASHPVQASGAEHPRQTAEKAKSAGLPSPISSSAAPLQAPDQFAAKTAEQSLPAPAPAQASTANQDATTQEQASSVPSTRKKNVRRKKASGAASKGAAAPTTMAKTAPSSKAKAPARGKKASGAAPIPKEELLGPSPRPIPNEELLGPSPRPIPKEELLGPSPKELPLVSPPKLPSSTAAKAPTPLLGPRGRAPRTTAELPAPPKMTTAEPIEPVRKSTAESPEPKPAAPSATPEPKSTPAPPRVQSSAATSRGGGLIGGERKYGAKGSVGHEREQDLGKGIKLSQSIGADAKTWVDAEEVPDSVPLRYRVTFHLEIAGKLGLGAKRDSETGGAHGGVSLSASGNLLMSVTHEFSREETQGYLAAIKSGGGVEADQTAEPELHMIQLLSAGKTDAARAMLAEWQAAAGSAEAARHMTEGSAVSVRAAGDTAGGIDLGSGKTGKSLGLKLGLSRSGSIERTVVNRDGRILVSLAVSREHGASGGLAAGIGVTSLGFEHGGTESQSNAVTFALDPKHPAFAARFAEIAAIDSIEGLQAYAAAHSELPASTTTGGGESTQDERSVGVMGTALSLGFEHRSSEETTRDRSGVTRRFDAAFGIGGSLALGGETVTSEKTTDAFVGEVGPDNRGRGEVTSQNSQTDLSASGRHLGKAFSEHPIGTTMGLLSGETKLIQQRVDTSGKALTDQSYQRLAELATDLSRWERAPGRHYRSSQDEIDWVQVRQEVLDANGDRAAIAKAIADYVSKGGHRSAVVDYAVGETGIGFEFPDELAAQKAVYDSLVIGEPLSHARELAEAGQRDAALEELTRDHTKLDNLLKAVRAKPLAFGSDARLLEMMNRIGQRRDEIGAEMRALAPAAPSAASPTAAPAAALARRDDAGMAELIANCKVMQAKEKAAFDWMNDQMSTWHFNHPGVVWDISHVLDRLRESYAVWDRAIEQLKTAYRARGGDPGQADAFGPDRRQFEAIHKRWEKW
jgi:hypothetical protein